MVFTLSPAPPAPSYGGGSVPCEPTSYHDRAPAALTVAGRPTTIPAVTVAAETLDPQARQSRWLRPTCIAWALIVLGTAVRLRIYLACRSLWTDEAMLSLNLIRRPLGRLLAEPLDFQQAAPPGFLLVQKAIVTVLGSGEYALRLVPLVSGVGVMILTYPVARRVTTAWPAVLALALVAFSKGLIEQSVVVKQYETDALVTLVVIAAALPLLQATAWRPATVARFAAVAVVAGWVSHPATFAVAGAAAVLLVQQAAARRWRNVGWAAAAAAPAAVGMVAEYVLVLRPLEASTYLHEFWIDGFLPLPFRLGRSVRWLLAAPVQPMSSPGGYKAWGVATAGLLLGVVALWRNRRATLALLAAPVLLAVGAAAAQRYPFVGRLSVFALPPLFVVTAVGVCSLGRWLPRRVGRCAACAVAAVLLVPAVVRAARWTVRPEPVEEIEPVLAYVQAHRRPADLTYVYRGARPAFLYYQAAAGLGSADVVFDEQIEPDALRADAARLAGRPRVWVVVTHANPDGHGSRVAPLLAALSAEGRKLDEVDGPGATATGYLFDLSAPPASHSRR